MDPTILDIQESFFLQRENDNQESSRAHTRQHTASKADDQLSKGSFICCEDAIEDIKANESLLPVMIEPIKNPHGVKLRNKNLTTLIVTNVDGEQESITQTHPLCDSPDFENRKSTFAMRT